MAEDNKPRVVAGGSQQQTREMRLAKSAQEGVEELRLIVRTLDARVKHLEERLAVKEKKAAK